VYDFSGSGRPRNTAPAYSFPRDLAYNVGDFPFQAAYSGFHCVVVDDLAYGVVSETDTSPVKTVFGNLPRQEETFGDFDFLVLGITGNFDNFHSVAQGVGDGMEGVCRCDEHDVR